MMMVRKQQRRCLENSIVVALNVAVLTSPLSCGYQSIPARLEFTNRSPWSQP